MTKEEWKEWYDRFREIFEDYYFAEQEYRNGKNKTIRDSAKRTMDILRGRAKNYVEDNDELLELVEFPDEMFSFQWFGGDLPKLLERLKEKCNKQN
jgi:hypothetical protein